MATNLDIITLLQRGLEPELRKAVHEKIMNSLLEEFRTKVEPMVAEYTGKIVVTGIERIRDITSIRDELNIYINGVDMERLNK
jgi:hypothetical protein